MIDNLSVVLSIAFMLQRMGVIGYEQIQNIQNVIGEPCADDLVPINNLVGLPNPLFHFVAAANLLKRIAGITPDGFLQSLTISQQRSDKLHQKFYKCMITEATKDAQVRLECRVADASFVWEPLRQNLEAIPSSIPRAHRVKYFNSM